MTDAKIKKATTWLRIALSGEGSHSQCYAYM